MSKIEVRRLRKSIGMSSSQFFIATQTKPERPLDGGHSTITKDEEGGIFSAKR